MLLKTSPAARLRTGAPLAARSSIRHGVNGASAGRRACIAAPAAFTEVETASMARLAADHPDASQQQAPLIALLSRAGRTKSVEPEVVEGALCTLERIASSSGRPLRSDQATVDGRWRLVFSTATKLRFFQYIPVIEDLNIEVAAKRIALESELGPFQFFIKGVINSWDEGSGLMGFEFNQVDIAFNGNKIWEVRPTPKPKTYSYYFLGADVGAARSSAGGVSLLIRNP